MNNVCKILSLQLREIRKQTYSQYPLEAAITLMEIFQTHGTPECYLAAISKSTKQSSATVCRHLGYLTKYGVITNEVRFKNSLRKYIELTDKGQYLLARIKRLSK